MQLDDPTLIAALRDTQPVETICRGAGISVEQFSAARDSYLRRHAALADQTITASVGGLVEIKRDRAGVPHIYAAARPICSSVWALRWRRTGYGRWTGCAGARLAGRRRSSGPAYVASDIAHLTVGIDQIADREATAMDDATRRVDRCVRRRNQPPDRGCRDRPADRIPAAGLCAGAVQGARHRGDRAWHLVVAERPHRPAGRRRGRAHAAERCVANALSDAGSVGEPGRPVLHHRTRAAGRLPARMTRPAATTGR